jgi:hypothetical protein
VYFCQAPEDVRHIVWYITRHQKQRNVTKSDTTTTTTTTTTTATTTTTPTSTQRRTTSTQQAQHHQQQPQHRHQLAHSGHTCVLLHGGGGGRHLPTLGWDIPKVNCLTGCQRRLEGAVPERVGPGASRAARSSNSEEKTHARALNSNGESACRRDRPAEIA